MAFSDKTTYAPLSLFEYSHKPGSYCLMLSDQHMVDAEEIFHANGRPDGNGYGWAGVARQAVRAKVPHVEGKVEYDPEAGSFVAYGQDLAALQALGGAMRDAFHDHALLAELIRGGEDEWFD